MVTRQEIIDYARTQLGVRWQHQQRMPGVATDCAGFIKILCDFAGLEVTLPNNYRRKAKAKDICRFMGQFGEPIKVEEAREADVLLFIMKKIKQDISIEVHCALMTGPDSMIHASASDREVVEGGIPDRYKENLFAAFRFPGVE